MARLNLPTVLLVAVVLATAQPGTASKQPEPSTTPTRFPPLMDCGPAPPVAPAGETDGFRANVLSVLRDIPSAAAATPDGFATARSGRTGHDRDRDRAFARGLCFGGANTPSSAARCRACLSAAARDATDRCGASRRAGVWRAGCYLSYGDTEALSAREEAFRGWFYATTAATLKDGVCVGDDCARCFKDAARAAVTLPWQVRMRTEVFVVGYSCCLRVQSYVPPIERMDAGEFLFFLMIVLTLVVETILVMGLLQGIITTLQEDIPQPLE